MNHTQTPDPSSTIAEALGELVAIAAPDREEWLRERFPTNDAMRAELRSLIAHVSPDAPSVACESLANDPRVDPWIGRGIAGCTVIRLLGAGGMGRVYEARQAGTGRLVALKLLDHGTTNEFLAARLRSEGAALGALEHPMIARVYQAGVVVADGQGAPYVVMEMVREARDARQWGETTMLGFADVLACIAACCDAVHYGHQRGVIHGDLKPSNVLFDLENRPRIIDFGTARLQDAVQGTERANDPNLAATPKYAAPEILGSRWSRPDARSDVYGLGKILAEVRAAAPALRHSGRRRRDLDAIIERAAAARAEDRYESAAALARDLRSLAADLPVDARQIGRIERSVRFMRRRPGTTLAIGGALLLISASITMLISAERRTRHALATSELSQAAIAVQGGDLSEAINRLRLASGLGTVDPLLAGMLARRTDQSMQDLAPRDGGNCTAAVTACDSSRLLIACDGGVRRCSLSDEQTVPAWVYRGRAAAGIVPGPEGSAAWIACRDGTLLQAASAGDAPEWNHFVPVPGVGIQSIAPGPSGAAILGMDDGSVKMVDRSGTHTELARAEPSAKGFGTFVSAGPSGQVLAAFPDGRVLLVHTDGTGAARELFRHPVAASAAFWDARNACAAIGYRDGLAVLVYPDRTEQPITAAFNNSIWSMAISPDGQTVAVGDRAGTMHICDANGLGTIRTMHAGTPDPFWWISYESTGESLIALVGDRSVRIPLHPSYPESIRLPAAVRGMINLPHSRLVAWTADGRMYGIDLHAGVARETGVRFDASRTRALAVGPQTGSVAAIEGDRLLIDGTAPADGPAIDATGDIRLAWATNESMLWLLQNGRVTAIQRGKDCSLSSHLGIAPEVPALAAMPDARLAISSSQGTWLVQEEHGKLSVTAKPDSGYRCWPVDGGLAFAIPNGSIRWVPQAGGDIRVFTGHTDIVWTCDYEPRRRLLATGGSDRKVRVWDFDTEEQLLALGEHEAPLTCVRWLENGHVLATADAAGLIHVWTDLPISRARTATDKADPQASRGLNTTGDDPIRSR